MDFLPIFLDIRGRPCLVVGGGVVAARKAALLGRAQGRVTVVAPKLCEELAQQAQDGNIEHRARDFQAGDLDGQVLAIAATDDPQVNRQVSELARARGVAVNVVDQPELCSFIMPSIVDRSPVQVAISTGGASPVLARVMRARLEACIPAAYGRLASLVEGFRSAAKQRLPDPVRRRRFWEEILQGPIAELVFAGKEEEAAAALKHAVEQVHEQPPSSGEVYLVGAGPGDPDLLTFRALRLMQQADVVVYDRLVSPPILDLVRRDAERIYAGKDELPRVKNGLGTAIISTPQGVLSGQEARRRGIGGEVLCTVY